MSLSVGIVGLPNVGKSTLFTALTKNEVLIANYPFATIDPSVGIVPVPDERLEKLSKISNSKKIIPAVVEFVDIAVPPMSNTIASRLRRKMKGLLE
jgi:ribosome-binding ATPase YchF (GTP1/OBG family)